MGLINGVSKVAIAAVMIALPAAASSTSSTSSTKHSSPSSKTHKHSSARTHLTPASSRRHVRGQQAIDPTRVREIQSALIREHYLQGEPSGLWDARTKEAMTRFQQDNGWQTKKVPDSRAIIKLGLGPNRADLINPNTAFVSPQPVGKGGSQQPQPQP